MVGAAPAAGQASLVVPVIDGYVKTHRECLVRERAVATAERGVRARSSVVCEES